MDQARVIKHLKDTCNRRIIPRMCKREEEYVGYNKCLFLSCEKFQTTTDAVVGLIPERRSTSSWAPIL